MPPLLRKLEPNPSSKVSQDLPHAGIFPEILEDDLIVEKVLRRDVFSDRGQILARQRFIAIVLHQSNHEDSCQHVQIMAFLIIRGRTICFRKAVTDFANRTPNLRGYSLSCMQVRMAVAIDCIQSDSWLWQGAAKISGGHFLAIFSSHVDPCTG